MKTTCINWKKLMNVAALGAVAFTPVLGVVGQSQAQPGYRNGRLTQTFRTLEGIVTRDPDRNGRDFVMRLDNGQTVAVRLAGNEPRRLSTNDRVRVYGRFTGNRFDATSLSILRDRYGNNDNNPGAYRTLEGVVTNDTDNRNRRDFVMRLDNGQRVSVRLDPKEPRRLSENDRVRVYGRFTGNRFDATSVTILRDRNGNNDNNDRRTVEGTVLDVNPGQRRFSVNANGRTYRVISSWVLPSGLNRGDRVRVSGRINNDQITNATTTIIGNYGNQTANFVFTGKVLDVNDNTNTIIVRRDNGVNLTVRASENDIDRLDRGDRVRVKGRYDRSIVYADDVDKL